MSAQQVIRQEIETIRHIIDDETWYEGERRGCPVARNDPVVLQKVCDVILQIGEELRQSVVAEEQS